MEVLRLNAAGSESGGSQPLFAKLVHTVRLRSAPSRMAIEHPTLHFPTGILAIATIESEEQVKGMTYLETGDRVA